MFSWRSLSLVILLLLSIFNDSTATPVSSEHSVEEQDPVEQIAEHSVDDVHVANAEPIYEYQLAVWPENEHDVHQPVLIDDSNAPVFEEQEIAYPVLTPEQNDDVHVVNNEPTWHQITTTTTERPINPQQPTWQQPQQIPVHVQGTWHQTSTTTKRPINPQQPSWQQPQQIPVHVQGTWHQTTTTTERPINPQQPTWQEPQQIPVHVEGTWHQNVPTTSRPKPQEIPIWHNPQNHGNSEQTEVVNVPVIVSVQPTVPASVPIPAPPPPPPQQQQQQPVTAATPIFPDIHFDEAEAIADQQDNADVLNDQVLISTIQNVLNRPRPTKRPVPHVEVIEQYQTVKPNGITEYKLVLSNGMTNYKKIYNKLLPNGKIVTVQEGFDSVPIPGDDPYLNDYQTQYYISDEFGHNVYKVEKHHRRPKLPSTLDYKEHGSQV